MKEREQTMIFGVPIDQVSAEDAYNRFLAFMKEDRLHTIFTPNTEIVMMAQEDEELKSILRRGDLVIPDGIGLLYASKHHDLGLDERIPGVEMMDRMLKFCHNAKKKVYLLGAKPGTVEAAAEKIRATYPHLEICGHHHGYFSQEEELRVIDAINESKPDILFVALGAPRQEKWIDAHRKILNAKVAMGVGGSIDIWAGTAKRAPKIFIDLHLEWFYRLLKNPSRIGRMMALPHFLLKVVTAKSIKD